LPPTKTSAHSQPADIASRAAACAARGKSSSAGVILERVDVGSSVPPVATPRWACIIDRELHVEGLSETRPIDLGPRAANGAVSSMNAKPMVPVDKLRVRAATAEPLLSVDVCLSFYHTYTDVIPSLFGLLHAGKLLPLETNSPRSPDTFPESLKLPMVPVFRSRCHVFHLASIIFLLPFATDTPIAFDGADFSDDAFLRALEGRLFVTHSPPEVALRKYDADFESPHRRRIVLEHDDAVCACGAVAAAEAQPKSYVAPAVLQGFFSRAMSRVLPVPSPAFATLWSGCDARDHRVLVMLRSHSRFVGNPADVMAALGAVPGLCARAYYFDELSVLLQFYAVRSAHALFSQHGAGLTYINVMGGPPAKPADFADVAVDCRRAVVEMWFVGKHSRSMSVYERAAGAGNMSYRLLLPTGAQFFDWGSGVTNGSATPRGNGTAAMSVTLPQGAVLETNPAANARRAKVMRKRGQPHGAQDFLTQLGFFDKRQLAAAAQWIAQTLSTTCPVVV